MTKNEVIQKIITLTAEKIQCEPKDITYKSKFGEDLRFDSLDCVEFVMDIEDEFDLTIPDEEAEKFITIDDAAIYVWTQLLIKEERAKLKAAVTDFSKLMLDKLEDKQKAGYRGWDAPFMGARIEEKLRQNLENGDYVDVANLAMMLHRFQNIQP